MREIMRKTVIVICLAIACTFLYMIFNGFVIMSDHQHTIDEIHHKWFSKVQEVYPDLVANRYIDRHGNIYTLGPVGVESASDYEKIQKVLSFEETKMFYDFDKKDVSIYLLNKYKKNEDAFLIYPAILDEMHQLGIYEKNEWQKANYLIIKYIENYYNTEGIYPDINDSGFHYPK